MKYLNLLIALIVTTSLFTTGALSAEQSALNCDIGPLKKTYGNTPWLVYSCTDNETIVIVSDAGSPAMPFVFSFHKKDNGYHLTGEGTGNKQATNAAYTELSKLTEPNLLQLITHTVNAKANP